MKRTIKSVLSVILVLACVLSLVSCGNEEKTDVWESAVYLEDTVFGNGSKTLTAEVKAEDKQVTFTVKTDKDTVGAALIEHGLISGEESQYGLYIKSVNGIIADYDVNGSYWAFYVDGEYAMSGADSTEIDESKVYQLVYAK